MDRPSLLKRRLEKETGETLYTEQEISEMLAQERAWQEEKYELLEQRYEDLKAKYQELNPPAPNKTNHPIFAAVAANDLDAVRAILEKEPYATDHHRKKDNYLPIHVAAEAGDLEMVKLFTDMGVSPNYRPIPDKADSPTVIDLAAINGYPELFTFLRSIGRGSYGSTLDVLAQVLPRLETTSRVTDYIEMAKSLIREWMAGANQLDPNDINACLKYIDTFVEYLYRIVLPHANKGRRFTEVYEYVDTYFREQTGKGIWDVRSDDFKRRHPELQPAPASPNPKTGNKR